MFSTAFKVQSVLAQAPGPCSVFLLEFRAAGWVWGRGGVQVDFLKRKY